jgi:hypothetical protein
MVMMSSARRNAVSWTNNPSSGFGAHGGATGR